MPIRNKVVNNLKKHSILFLFAWMILFPLIANASKINIIAAENFYGDIARQIGGNNVNVSSILFSPDQDPHLFEASTSTAIAITKAQVVIYNGIGYDSWMIKLLSSTPNPKRKIIIVSTLAHRHDGDNPHIWYDPATMRTLAHQLSTTFSAINPGKAKYYQKNLEHFLASMSAITNKISIIRKIHPNVSVTATEPVVNYLTDALGFQMRNLRFQLSIMNSAEPSVSDVAAFQNDLKNHRVRILFYNKQATSPIAGNMQSIAKQYKIPVIGVTETEPGGELYQNWIMNLLNKIEETLSNKIK